METFHFLITFKLKEEPYHANVVKFCCRILADGGSLSYLAPDRGQIGSVQHFFFPLGDR